MLKSRSARNFNLRKFNLREILSAQNSSHTAALNFAAKRQICRCRRAIEFTAARALPPKLLPKYSALKFLKFLKFAAPLLCILDVVPYKFWEIIEYLAALAEAQRTAFIGEKYPRLVALGALVFV